MSEIEKMMQNANIISKRCSECDNNMDCGYGKDCYPPFTAEKQLEICKFLLKVEHSISYYFYENRYGFVIDDKQDDCIEAEKFETALAMIVNNLWQDLTEEEKASIKNILEM